VGAEAATAATLPHGWPLGRRVWPPLAAGRRRAGIHAWTYGQARRRERRPAREEIHAAKAAGKSLGAIMLLPANGDDELVASDDGIRLSDFAPVLGYSLEF